MRRLVVLAIVFGAAVGAILALVAALYSVPARTVTPVHDATSNLVTVTLTTDAPVPIDAATIDATVPIDAPHPRPRPVRVAVDGGVVQAAVDAGAPASSDPVPSSPADRAKLAKELFDRASQTQVNGQKEEALRLYTQSYQLAPSNWTKLQIALMHYALNTVDHWKEAVRLAKQVIASNPAKFDLQRAKQISSWAGQELLVRGIDPDSI